jgi:hypothetical protein
MNQPSQPDGVYLYCVAHAEPFAAGHASFVAPGIGGRGDSVRTVRYEDLVAVVSDAPKIRYTLRREYLVAHEGVIEEAMSRSDVLPVSFGTVADNDRQIQETLLQREFDRLHGYLKYLKDRVDLELKVHWNQEWLFTEIAMENDEIRTLRDFITSHHPEATYYERIQLGELTEHAINEKRAREAESILREFAAIAVEYKVNRQLTDLMILSASFLVERDREAEFDALVQALHERQVGRLLLQYVGPVPPYNFVTLKVRWQDTADAFAV